MEKKVIQVLIADDTDISRAGLRDILETAKDIVLVGETDSVYAIPRLIDELSPDVLIMDLKWYDDESAGWIKIGEVKKENPELKLIAITAYPNLIADARKAGADQVVTKSLKREELLNLIRNVARSKKSPHSPDAASLHTPDQLSRREIEVLSLIDKGLSDKEISQALNIQVNATKNHVKNLRQKLNAENRRKASIKARELGILH
jgi:DNA-binding NarL/FixJ family response regulator